MFGSGFLDEQILERLTKEGKANQALIEGLKTSVKEAGTRATMQGLRAEANSSGQDLSIKQYREGLNERRTYTFK